AAEIPRRIEDVRHAAAHPGRKIPPRLSEHDHAAARHVLAAMVADALDHGVRPAVSDRESLARDAADVRLAARRAIQRDVADDDVLFRDKRRLPRRIDDDLPARQPFPDIVVRVALEAQGDAPRYEGAEAL